MSQSSAIVAANIVKIYGTGAAAAPALRGVSLRVEPGEVLFLTGPSGSGKTTLLSILGCVLRPSSGKLCVFGTEVSQLSERELCAFRLRTLGFVFQGHNLIASQTALQNVRLPLLLQGITLPAAEAMARQELDRVGLHDKCNSKPADLSGGQKQRVAIARALVTNPPLILADEPTASLDAKSGHAVMALLAQLARERGTTVVVVTHDNRIFEFAERTVAIEDGRLFAHRAA